MISLLFLTLVSAAEAPQTQTIIQKKIVYQKETSVDLSNDGSSVDGEAQLPPAFFLMKNKTPKARSLLLERLNFGMKDYNPLGF